MEKNKSMLQLRIKDLESIAGCLDHTEDKKYNKMVIEGIQNNINLIQQQLDRIKEKVESMEG